MQDSPAATRAPLSRWKAATLHLALSAAAFVLIGVPLLWLWYPPEYFRAAGAATLTGVLALVHLTLGPLLTLIVFRSGKWGMKFDLIAIGVLQTLAFAYGLSVVAKARPVFLVAVPDRFVLVSAGEISDADLDAAHQAAFRTRSWTGPRLVAAEIPSDPKERSDLAFSALSGRDLENQPKYFVDYEHAAKGLLANAHSLDVLLRKHPECAQLLAENLARTGRDAASVRWLPLAARSADMVMLIDADSAQLLRPLPIDPW